LLAGRIDIDERHMDIRNYPPTEVADQCADDTHSNDRNAIAVFGAGVPHGVECGLMLAARTARAGVKLSGSGTAALPGMIKRV
jgi:hypothetical protein